MPRIITVQKARAVPGLRRCGRCGKDIQAGEKYFHWSNRTPGGRGGHKSIRCADHYPRPSEYTASPYRAAAYSIQEGIEDFLAGDWTPEELAEELRTAAENVRDECAGPLNEGADNIEDGFGHETYQSSEMRERADAFESWADEIESAADDIQTEGFEDECEIEDCDHDSDECDAYAAAREEARDAADSVMAQCPE